MEILAKKGEAAVNNQSNQTTTEIFSMRRLVAAVRTYSRRCYKTSERATETSSDVPVIMYVTPPDGKVAYVG